MNNFNINLLIFILSIINILLTFYKFSVINKTKDLKNQKEELETVLLISKIFIISIIIALFISIIISYLIYKENKNYGYLFLIVFHILFIVYLIPHFLKEEKDKTTLYNELFIFVLFIITFSSGLMLF